MPNDDIRRRIESRRDQERRCQSACEAATTEALSELEAMADELRGLQRSVFEARSLKEPRLRTGTASPSSDGKGVDASDWAWEPRENGGAPHLVDIVGFHTLSYNPIRRWWLPSGTKPVTREQAIDLFKDQLAEWVALQYPRLVQAELDGQAAKRAAEEKQRLLGEQVKSKHLSNLTAWGLVFLASVFSSIELHSQSDRLPVTFEELFVDLAAYGTGLFALISGGFTIGAAFTYFFD